MDKARRLAARRPGVALLIVLMIGLLAFIAVTGLLGAIAPRQRIVSGEAVSDRALSLADGFIDQLLAQINAQGELTKSAQGATTAEDPIIKTLLADLNGGNPETGSLGAIRQNVRSYAFDASMSEYYRVDEAVFTKGILTSGLLVSVEDGNSVGTIASVDSSFASDNRWFQIDTNCDYRYSADKPDVWMLRVTAFNVSVPELRRTVQADAGRGEVAIGDTWNWYRLVKGPSMVKSFCEYAGFYNNGASFGLYEVISGPIGSNGSISMSGWALEPGYAGQQVSDGSNHTGRFGPTKWKLSKAISEGYAVQNYPKAVWSNGTDALFGSSAVRSAGDTGMQDKCLESYYVNGDATVVFAVESGIGKVTITPAEGAVAKLDMPPNGIIFVEGNAHVSGTVHGRCTVGCRHTITLEGNVVYSIPPRVNRADPMPSNPDALGLVAGEQVFIPASVYASDRTLEIDAAMFSATGGLQIDPAASSHKATGTPHYEAFWNGSQAMYDASKTPLADLGNGYVRGYELQHTNFDWNLKDYGAPPMFPTTGTQAIPGEKDYILLRNPEDDATLNQLAGIAQAQLNKLTESDSDYDPQTATFYYVVGGTRYYTRGSAATAYARYSPDQNSLSCYRVSSREQIATPVRQP